MYSRPACWSSTARAGLVEHQQRLVEALVGGVRARQQQRRSQARAVGERQGGELGAEVGVAGLERRPRGVDQQRRADRLAGVEQPARHAQRVVRA